MKQFKQRFWTYRAYVVLAPFLERANKLFFCVNHLVEQNHFAASIACTSCTAIRYEVNMNYQFKWIGNRKN